MADAVEELFLRGEWWQALEQSRLLLNEKTQQVCVQRDGRLRDVNSVAIAEEALDYGCTDVMAWLALLCNRSVARPQYQRMSACKPLDAH